MTFDEFRAFAETKIQTDWTATPIEFENATESDALKAAKDSKTPWIRFTIRDGGGELITVGSDSRLDRFVGLLIIQIFVAQKTGTGQARRYADQLSGFWKGYAGQPCVQILTPSINVIGENEGWFQINVNIPFQNDEFST